MGGKRIWMAVLAAGCMGASAQDEISTLPQTFYIDVSYLGEESGTSDEPFRSIGEAVSNVIPGRMDTLIVRPGEYDENFLLPPGATLRAERGPYETALVSNAATAETIIALTEDSILEGFTVGPTLGDGAVVFADNSAEVRNCVFIDAVRGLAVQGGGAVHAVNNTFYNNQVSVQGEAGATVIDVRNNIFANDGVGVLLAEGASLTSAYNTFDGNGPPVFGGQPGDLAYARSPGFADADNGNFRIRGDSPVKNAGDPDPIYNDRDDTRNDLGADGGPFGEPDTTAPQAMATFGPTTGQAPLTVTFDASETMDLFGLDSIEWDFDVWDGIDFGDAIGATVTNTFTVSGRYIVGLRATDSGGRVTEVFFDTPIDIGDPVPVEIVAALTAGPAPLVVSLGLDVTGDVERVDWDFDDDGNADINTLDTVFELPAGSEPGVYNINARVFDAADRASVDRAGITLTTSPVLAQTSVIPGGGATVTVDDPTSPFAGASLSFADGAVTFDGPITLGEPGAAAFPFLPEGDFLRSVEVGPANIAYGDWVTVSVPTPDFNRNFMRRVQVFRFDPDTNQFTNEELRSVRLFQSGGKDLITMTERVEFQITRGGSFVIIGEPFDTGPFGCVRFTDEQRQRGDLGVLGLVVVVLVAGSHRRKKQG